MVLEVEKHLKKKELIPIPDHLISHVLSFCDASDFIMALKASRMYFDKPLTNFLASTPALSLSFLLRCFPNRFHNDQQQQQQQQQQEVAVTILLHLLSSAYKCTNDKPLKYLELANLRSVSGRNWFPRLSDIPLVVLDLSNNVRLERYLLFNFLNQCPSNTLKHLTLTGCRQMNPAILEPLRTQRHTGLISLSLAHCSHSIQTEWLFSLLQNLKRLQHLNLQGLTMIDDWPSRNRNDVSFVDILPTSLKSINLSESKPLQLSCQGVVLVTDWFNDKSLEFAMVDSNCEMPRVVFIWNDAAVSRLKLTNLVLDGMGNHGRGVQRGVVAMFSLGRQLREVHLAGCEMTLDWEIEALAYNCRHTLTCFQMRGGKITNGILSLAEYCDKLSEVDVSACMDMTNNVIAQFCSIISMKSHNNNDGNFSSNRCAKKRRLECQSRLRVLRIAGCSNLTDAALREVASLMSLLILDIHHCSNFTAQATHDVVQKLPRLIELDAREIENGAARRLTQLLRSDPLVTKSLCIVNQRRLATVERLHQDCCSAQSQSQRLNNAIPLQSMYHCVDCDLIPSLDRGICSTCVRRCHSDHKTFLGSYARFYCDCGFGVANDNDCKSMTSNRNSMHLDLCKTNISQ